MSEQSIQEALKQAGAPDYMVLIITKIVSAEDAIREMQASLSRRSVELSQREQVHEEQQEAFVKAVKDMNEFTNRIFGPESELAKINSEIIHIKQRVADLEKSA